MNHAAELALMAADTELSVPYREAAQWALERLAEPPAVTVKPLVWDDFHGRGAKAQAWNDANYMIQKWNDGRWEISASYPGYSTFIEGADRFYPTLEAAKSAAQADYAARILAAIDARTGHQITSNRALGRFGCEREWPARPDLSARQY